MSSRKVFSKKFRQAVTVVQFAAACLKDCMTFEQFKAKLTKEKERKKKFASPVSNEELNEKQTLEAIAPTASEPMDMDENMLKSVEEFYFYLDPEFDTDMSDEAFDTSDEDIEMSDEDNDMSDGDTDMSDEETDAGDGDTDVSGEDNSDGDDDADGSSDDVDMSDEELPDYASDTATDLASEIAQHDDLHYNPPNYAPAYHALGINTDAFISMHMKLESIDVQNGYNAPIQPALPEPSYAFPAFVDVHFELLHQPAPESVMPVEFIEPVRSPSPVIVSAMSTEPGHQYFSAAHENQGFSTSSPTPGPTSNNGKRARYDFDDIGPARRPRPRAARGPRCLTRSQRATTSTRASAPASPTRVVWNQQRRSSTPDVDFAVMPDSTSSDEATKDKGKKRAHEEDEPAPGSCVEPFVSPMKKLRAANDRAADSSSPGASGSGPSFAAPLAPATGKHAGHNWAIVASPPPYSLEEAGVEQLLSKLVAVRMPEVKVAADVPPPYAPPPYASSLH